MDKDVKLDGHNMFGWSCGLQVVIYNLKSSYCEVNHDIVFHAHTWLDKIGRLDPLFTQDKN